MLIRSIEACDNHLRTIDVELKLLELQRKQVLEIREFLVQHGEKVPRRRGVRISNNPPGKLRVEVLRLVRDNPGLNSRQLWEKRSDPQASFRRFSSTLNNLRTAGEIVNTGSTGSSSRWFIKEN
jgi:hypothetical protein